MNSDDTTVVAGLVARALELADGGATDIPYDEICAEHPHLREDVKEAVGLAMALPELHAQGDVDRFASTIFAGRYRLRERLGSGAMGVVYSAIDLDLGRPLAIKVMQSTLLEQRTALARFEREATALAAVQHPSVVTIYDRGVTPDGTSFLAMELVQGVPCSRILELARERHADDDGTAWLLEDCGLESVDEPSFLRQVMRWAADVASGLAQAHAAGVVHRDVKPSNIIVRPNGKAVLLDFGIASRDEQESLTQTGAAVGTPAYMAPEALTGSNEARPSQDAYGLAATLYHMLTLEAPYTGPPHEVLAAIAVREPVPAAKLRPGIPRDAQAILDHGLARDPGSRYSSMLDMESDLRALLAYRPVGVRPTTALTRLWRQARRSKVALGAVIATVIIFAVLGAREVHAADLHRRGLLFDEAWPAITANLGIVRPENRIAPEGEARKRLRAALDQLVDSERDPLVAHTLRATFRLDHGDQVSALEDMRAVAAHEGTAYARALADRYGALPPGTFGVMGLDLANMPAPESAGDTYLAGFHAIRQRDIVEGGRLFADERLLDNRHVQEIRILIDVESMRVLRRRGDIKALLEAGDLVLARAQEVSSMGRYPGATVGHALCSAYLSLGMYRRSLEEAERVLARSPWSQVSLQNAAKASFHSGQWERGLELCDRALRVTPAYTPLLQIRTKLLSEAGRFQEARATARSMEYEEPPSQAEVFRLVLLVGVDLEELKATATVDPDRALEVAREAESRLDRLTKPANASFRDAARARVRAYITGDSEQLAEAFLLELNRDPTSLPALGGLVDQLPSEASPELWAAIATYLERLHQQLSLPTEISTR